MKKGISLLLFFGILLISSYSYCQKPIITAQSAILVDLESGRVLLEYSPHTKLPMASTTKIMTGLIALENCSIEDKITIKRESVGVEGSSIYLYEGESIGLEDLLYGLMLRSGNDAAVAIADYVGGNIEQFIIMMNDKARSINANNTNFMNPHGLHHDDHYTTAYDLALITKEAMKFEKFREIVGSKSWKANREKNNIFYNKNSTLWEYEGGNGVKTGYTMRAGRCLVSSSTRNDRTLIAIVLNDRNWFNDCYSLLNYGFEHFKDYVIFDEGQYFRSIPVIDGDKEYIAAVAKKMFFYPLKEEELKNIKIHIDLPDKIKAPIGKGDSIGKVKIYLDGIMIHEESIIAKENISKLGPIQKLIKELIKKDNKKG